MEGDEKSCVHVGSLVEVEWPFDDGSSRKCFGHVREVRRSRTTKAGCSKKFRIRFDDGQELWSRLNGSFSILSSSGEHGAHAGVATIRCRRGHPRALTCVSSLSMLLTAREALEVSRRVRSDWHVHTLIKINPNTLVRICNLSTLLMEKGKLDSTEPLAREDLEVSRWLLGDRHPNTLISISNLSALLTNQGKHDEAEALAREALKVSRQVLGDHHPDTLISINSLSMVLINQGKFNAWWQTMTIFN